MNRVIRELNLSKDRAINRLGKEKKEMEERKDDYDEEKERECTLGR